MFLLDFALQRRTLMAVLTLALAWVGIRSFFELGRLEDPEFTIKTALVVTQYPGATAVEVEEEVTDQLEEAIQELGQVDDVKSISKAGQSVITVDLLPTAQQKDIPQIWDELRRKINDAQVMLPPGARASIVVDDFGDVYGVFFAITGDGYSLPELEDVGDVLKQEILRLDGVASVELFGTMREAVDIEISSTRLAELGITPNDVVQTIDNQSKVVESGRVHSGGFEVRVDVSGAPTSTSDLEELLVRGRSGHLTRLGDIAKIRRVLMDPPSQMMFYDGQAAVGLGVSTVAGGNVVDTGDRVSALLEKMEARLPLGVELGTVAFQSETVTEAVDAFIVNLVEAVVIVVGLLLLFMGLSSGLLIGGVLILTILGTFMFMQMYDIALQRISLGGLIIALGMLVDNAIVVVEGMLVRIQRGESREQAARVSVAETMWPLLGATGVAVMAFGAISLSPDSSGEFLGSLFQVILISLSLSWVLAVTITPLFGIWFLPQPKVASDGESKDPHHGGFYGRYRQLLAAMIHHRWLTIGGVGALLVVALFGFGFVKHNFFPDSSRNQFLVDYWRAEGSDIEVTAEEVLETSEWIRSLDGVTHTSSYVGGGALRFILTYAGERPNTAYGQVIVTVEDHQLIPGLRKKVQEHLRSAQPAAEPITQSFAIGPGGGAKIEARFSGPDPAVLRRLGAEAEQIIRETPNTIDVRNDWRSRVPVLYAHMVQSAARRAGVSRASIGQGLALSTHGMTIGLYRAGEDLLPIRLRLPAEERHTVGSLESASTWSGLTGRSLPIRQVIEEPEVTFEDGLIRRRNRERTLTVQANPAEGVASTLFASLRPQVEAIPLPEGYRLEWGGEYESSTDANTRLMANVPLFLALMFLIVVGLFDAIRTPVIVFSTLPLSLIGVTAGLLVFDAPFGFVALLGFLSLAGMLIKNAIVLIEQIELNKKEGMAEFDAVLDAGVSRVRPVAMAAFTTVLGMIPLASDVFFGALAVTIMGGLSFATLLTLLVVPVLYATFYRIPSPKGPI